MAVSIVKELRSRGYTVVDWNASSEDATGINYSSKKMAHFAIRDIRADKKPVVLSHDASFKHKTPATAALIIKYCEKHGIRHGEQNLQQQAPHSRRRQGRTAVRDYRGLLSAGKKAGTFGDQTGTGTNGCRTV